MRSVDRGSVAPGEHVVVLGAGPIGQALALAAIDRGASVLVLDTVATRLERAAATGADVHRMLETETLRDIAREWAGGDGPQVVFEATGVAGLRAVRRRSGRAGRPGGRRQPLE